MTKSGNRHGRWLTTELAWSWLRYQPDSDLQGRIVASTVTENNEQDLSQVPELLDQIDGEIDRFVADGIYDQQPVYAAVEDHSPGAQVVIPPRKDAVPSPSASTAPTQRDQHLLEIERIGRFKRKRVSGYYNQAHAENVLSRFKRTFGDRLRAKRDKSQEREAVLACELLNRMLELGRPQSSPIRSAKIGVPEGNVMSALFVQQRLYIRVC